jgi:hypothetical protein
MNVRKHPNILEQQTNQSSGGSGTTAWGLITGTLSAQADLQAALNAKVSTASPVIVNSSADRVVSSAYPTYATVTGLATTFTTTRANQPVLIIFQLSALASGNGRTAFLAYTFDAGSDVPILAHTFEDSGYGNLSITVPFIVVTPGSHTVQLRAAQGTGNYTFGSTALSVEMPCAISAILL